MFIKSFILFAIFLTSLYSFDYSQIIKDKKIYPLGKKIYDKKCTKITEFISKDALASQIKKHCKKLKPKHNEALSIYLWDKHLKSATIVVEMRVVDKKEKCPVCGMWIYKYPKWVAQIQTGKLHLSFDGVKDLMKYYFEKNIDDVKGDVEVVVRDYYSQKALDAKKSYFVLGSDVYGPMGEELIPFKTYEDAQTFLMDHKAKKIVKFSEITKADLY